MKAIFEIGPVEQEIFWEWGCYSNRLENERRWASMETPERTAIEVSYEITWRYQSSDGFKKVTK